MTLTLIESPWWLLLIIPVAAVAAWWMYRRTRDMIAPPMRWLLMGLRFVSLCLAAWLLLQPILRSLRTITYPPIVAFLQDDTESLVIHADSAYVQSEYPRAMDELLNSLDSEAQQLDGYRFGSRLQTGLSSDSLTFDMQGTNIAGALQEMDNLYQNLNLGAVVIASDGISTAGRNPLYAVEELGVPVYTVLLGDTTPQRDVRIREVLYNEIAYLETEMPIRVRVQTEGYDGASLSVSVRSGGKTLKTETLNLGRNRPQGEVDFLVEPEEVGLQAYDVVVSRLDGEITYRNNQQRFFVNVLETRVKIALFAGAPHPDLGALNQAFEREKGYEITRFILESPGQFYDEPDLSFLKEADLIILHNYPQSSADQPAVAEIARIVEEEKKPLMAFIGMGADLRAMQPLYKWLAVSPQNFNQRAEEVILNISPSYRRHSTFTFEDRWVAWANASPPLYRPQAAWQTKADAEVLATVKIRNIPLDYPVYVLQNYLGRKNMVFLGENFWRMRTHSYLTRDDFEWFDAWLFNNIKWLMVSDDKRKFRVDPTKKIFPGREPVAFRGQVYDDSYNPISGVEIKLALTDPAGKENEYYLSETQDAQYFLELGTLPAGTYRYAAEGRQDNVLVGRDRGEFSVGRSGVEHINLRADLDAMQQIALRSGGQFFYARELPQLAQAIQNQENLLPRRDARPSREPLRNYLWPLLLLLALLGVEWILRKVNSQV